MSVVKKFLSHLKQLDEFLKPEYPDIDSTDRWINIITFSYFCGWDNVKFGSSEIDNNNIKLSNHKTISLKKILNNTEQSIEDLLCYYSLKKKLSFYFNISTRAEIKIQINYQIKDEQGISRTKWLNLDSYSLIEDCLEDFLKMYAENPSAVST